MSMLNDFGKKLGVIAEITVIKAKEFTEIVKLNSSISSEENKIEEAYIEIGKLVYEQIKGQSTGKLAELCEKIQKSQGKIDKYKAQMEQVKSS